MYSFWAEKINCSKIRCRANNSEGSDETSLRLYQLGSNDGLEITFINEQHPITEGDQVSLDCAIGKRKKLLSPHWYYNGVKSAKKSCNKNSIYFKLNLKILIVFYVQTRWLGNKN